MVIFRLAPDQTIAQMWSNGARGGGGWISQKQLKWLWNFHHTVSPSL